MDPRHTLEAVRRHLRPDSRYHARHRALRTGGRAPLPLHHHAGRLLPAHRQLGQHPQGVGRRHGHLRRHLRRHLGGVPVVPSQALSVRDLRRCHRPRAARGPGHRPTRQLVQPGALRLAHHVAVGPEAQRRGRHRQIRNLLFWRAMPGLQDHAVPPDVPVRDASGTSLAPRSSSTSATSLPTGSRPASSSPCT